MRFQNATKIWFSCILSHFLFNLSQLTDLTDYLASSLASEILVKPQ